jgi:hypothetical protein
MNYIGKEDPANDQACLFATVLKPANDVVKQENAKSRVDIGALNAPHFLNPEQDQTVDESLDRLT